MICRTCGGDTNSTSHICGGWSQSSRSSEAECQKQINGHNRSIINSDPRSEKQLLIEILGTLKAIEQRIHNLEEEE